MDREIKEFDNEEAFYSALANDVETLLKSTINENGVARILLSGGSSPIPLYQKLAWTDLDWSKIEIGLVDERFVPRNHEHSNECMIRKMLSLNGKNEIKFHSMVQEAFDYKCNAEIIEKEYAIFENADLTILGMGEDGHTASIFPNDENSERCYQASTFTALTNAPNFPFKRITCTPKTLLSSKNTFLLVKGNKKVDIYQNTALNLPIHRLTNAIHASYLLL